MNETETSNTSIVMVKSHLNNYMNAYRKAMQESKNHRYPAEIRKSIKRDAKAKMYAIIALETLLVEMEDNL